MGNNRASARPRDTLGRDALVRRGHHENVRWILARGEVAHDFAVEVVRPAPTWLPCRDVHENTSTPVAVGHPLSLRSLTLGWAEKDLRSPIRSIWVDPERNGCRGRVSNVVLVRRRGGHGQGVDEIVLASTDADAIPSAAREHEKQHRHRRLEHHPIDNYVVTRTAQAEHRLDV